MADLAQPPVVQALAGDANRLFILDARNRVERRLMLDWIHATAGDLDGAAAPQWVSLPLSDQDEDWPLDQLAQRLDRGGDFHVIPLRVAWRIPGFERDRSLKFRHLLFGDPRLLGYGVLMWLGFHAFVVAVEEPVLVDSFGTEYEDFRANVPRWIPRLTPWRAARRLNHS